jgi:glycosyltransferase involved in cell wall biosynthesis
MNLLIISRCPPLPLHLGDRLLLYHVVRHMAAAGHSLDLLAYYDDPADPSQVAAYAPLFRAVDLIPDAVRSPAAYLSRLVIPGALFPRHVSASWSPHMWNAVRSALRRRPFDAVLLFGGVQVYEFRALVKHLPTVIVPYESYSLYLGRAAAQQTTVAGRARAAMMRWAAAAYEGRMFAGFNRVVLISEVDAAHVRRLNARYPLSVIPSGVDHAYFKPPSPDPAPPDGAALPRDPTLIFFGNLAYAPNADAAHFLVADIFPLVRQRLPNARLLLVGNAPSPSLAGVGVTVTGRVPDLRPYIAEADVFICPLRFGAGIKNKMLEAMAMGKPAVATLLSADGFAMRSGEHVLFGTTAAELAEAAIRLLQDAALRAQMGAANRALVEAQYSWQRAADQYMQVIDEAVNAARLAKK